MYVALGRFGAVGPFPNPRATEDWIRSHVPTEVQDEWSICPLQSTVEWDEVEASL